ncbi:MAG: TrkA family potassium uptake protein [Planctomycetota bacterium]
MKQVLVIGLGQFGFSLAESLTEKGVEVLAVDQNEAIVEKASKIVAQAVSLDATDEEALESLEPEKRDVCVCGIGDESRDAATICTALLRQMGAPKVIARAGSQVQQRILRLVGAHEVVNPDREFGVRFANQIAYENIISNVPLSTDLQLTEVKFPEPVLGKALSELKLPSKFGVVVVGIRKATSGEFVLPQGVDRISQDDRLILVSKRGAVTKMIEEA